MTKENYRRVLRGVPLIGRYFKPDPPPPLRIVESSPQLYMHIYSQMALSPGEFNRTVVPVLKRAQVDIEMQSMIVNCLKHRKGERIPSHVEVEKSAELKHIMSFGLIVSVVLEGFFAESREENTPAAVSILLIPDLLPEHAFRWLMAYPDALYEVVKYLTERDKSCYGPIVDRVLSDPNGATKKESNHVLDYVIASADLVDGVIKMYDGALFVAYPEGLKDYAEKHNTTPKKGLNRLRRQGLHRAENNEILFAYGDYKGMILDLES